jgi:hypothetical protein
MIFYKLHGNKETFCELSSGSIRTPATKYDTTKLQFKAKTIAGRHTTPTTSQEMGTFPQTYPTYSKEEEPYKSLQGVHKTSKTQRDNMGVQEMFCCLAYS